MSSSILQHIKDCTILLKQKEDEVTWSKIDTIFTKLKDELQSIGDCKNFLDQNSDLLIRSILSERSKLSGTSLALLKKIFDIMKNDVTNINNFLTAILKLSGRTNKIVYNRAHDALVHICQYFDSSQYSKIFAEYFESTNKNIRLGVVKALNSSNINMKLMKIIEKGKSDPSVEIRNICKSYKNEPKNEEPAKIEKKEMSPQKISCGSFIKPEIKHSPFKKMPKIEKPEEISPCNKITELEKQVKAISNIKKVEKKVKPIQFKPQIKFIKEKKEIQDDLTPKKLDKYLSKYRTLYGNLLEEDNKKSDSKENNEYFYGEEKEVDEIADLSREVENMSIVEESQGETLKYEYTIMNSEKTVLVEPKEEFEIKDVEVKDVKDVEVKEELKEDKEENDKEDKEENDKEVKEENDKEENDKEMDIQTLNEVVDEILKDKKEEEVVEIVNEYERISNSEIKCSPRKSEPVKQVESVSLGQNRFSSLLFADKEECVIYDINADSPLFKETKLSPSKSGAKLSPSKSNTTSPKSVINTAVSSSFLYSNENSENNNSVDYTKIDSVVYVDKNLFSKTKDN